jgi:hypothetical protein
MVTIGEDEVSREVFHRGVPSGLGWSVGPF